MRGAGARLALLAVLRAACAAALDFAPLQQEVRAALLREPLAPCQQPGGAVMITYVNHHAFSLLQLQREAMELGGMRECIEQRFVTVCLDARCPEMCREFGVPNCVDLSIETAASPFLTRDFTYIVYVKHEIMLSALSIATEVFFVDTDALIFDDPWRFPMGTYDLMHQSESATLDVDQCSAQPNGGQLYVRQTPAALQFLENMMTHKEDILDGHKGLGQGYIVRAAEAAGASRCALNQTLFAGHCEARNRADSVAHSVVYHFSCLSTYKHRHMSEALESRRGPR